MFEWNQNKIRFRIDSAVKTSFHATIAQWIAERFDDASQISLCDAGCGLGYLSLALSKYFKQVTAIDISDIALSVLRRESSARQIENLTILREDLLDDPFVKPRSYDAMVFSFFGNIQEILQIAVPRCKNRIFILKKNDHHHRFSISHAVRERDSMAAALSDLTALGLPFVKKDMTIEDGQPLRSLADAEEFFHLYARGSDRDLITRDYIQSLLEETGDSVFPYYYRRDCVFSILTVDLSGQRGDTL